MEISVNKPQVIATSGISAKLRLTAVPRPEVGAVAYDVGGAPFADTLTLHDAATLAGATSSGVIFSAPGDVLLSSLGQTIDLGVTSVGLVVSAWPAGLAAIISWS